VKSGKSPGGNLTVMGDFMKTRGNQKYGKTKGKKNPASNSGRSQKGEGWREEETDWGVHENPNGSELVQEGRWGEKKGPSPPKGSK